MKKIEISTNVFVPMPVVLVGTRVNGKVNFMTVGWCTRANANPPMILCGINRSHYTSAGIASIGTFSVNIPSASMVEKTDYCGLVSGKTVNKATVFDVFYGKLGTAPMIQECPITLECRLVQTVDLPTNYLFIGEICGAYADRRFLKEKLPDFEAIDPLILTMPDNTYRHLGGIAGTACSAGKKLMERT